jgi:hypothetical protein
MHSIATDGRRFGKLMLADDGRLNPWLYWAFGLSLILPVWAGQHFPSEDGMAHLYWVDVFRQLGHGGSAWEPFYERNAQWNTPNLAYFAIHYALAGIFEAHLALQIFLTLLILSWIASGHYLSTRVSGHLGLGAMASLLLIHSSWLYGGFFSLLVGVPILLVSLGLLASIFGEQKSSVGVSPFIVLASLGVVSYYSHFVSACLFLLLVFAFIVFFARRDPRTTASVTLALVPTGLLCLSYLLGKSSGLCGPRWEPVSESVAKFVGQAYFRGLGAPTPWFWLALGVFVVILLVLCTSVLNGARSAGVPLQRQVIIALALLLVALYFLAPDRVGQGGNLKARMQFAMWAWLLPALPFSLSAKAQRIMLAAVCLVLTWQVADFTARARRFNVAYDGVLAAAEQLPQGTTLRSVLKYDDAGYERSFVRVLAHFTEDIGYHRRSVVVAGYHPARAFYWVRPRPMGDTVPEYRLTIVPTEASRLALLINGTAGVQSTAQQAGAAGRITGRHE